MKISPKFEIGSLIEYTDNSGDGPSVRLDKITGVLARLNKQKTDFIYMYEMQGSIIKLYEHEITAVFIKKEV